MWNVNDAEWHMINHSSVGHLHPPPPSLLISTANKRLLLAQKIVWVLLVWAIAKSMEQKLGVSAR